MLKISQSEATNSHLSLRLEGRVVGPWVRELSQICELILSGGHKLKLDLGDVSFVDDKGASILESLRSRGVLLAYCSPFVEEQLKSSAAG